MNDGIGVVIFFSFLLVLFVIFIIVYQVTAGSEFKDSQKQIKEGMTIKQVISIMGNDYTCKTMYDRSYKLYFEKSLFRGILRKPNIFRVEIVFSPDDIVISIIRSRNL